MTDTIDIAVQVLRHGVGLPLPDYATDGAAGMDAVAALDAPLTLAPGDHSLFVIPAQAGTQFSTSTPARTAGSRPAPG